MRFLDECENRLNGELEVTNVLEKLRSSESILSELQNKYHKDLMRFSKSRVIDFSDNGLDLDTVEEKPEETADQAEEKNEEKTSDIEKDGA
jgi:hypothetical protein